MRSRIHASYPALLLTLAHLGCSGDVGGSDEALATESSALSSNISWTSSAMLVDPANTAWASVKDPTVVYHNGKYHVYATIYNTSVSTWQMIYFNFTDWSQAGNASQYAINQVSGFNGYNCAPQLFHFPPHNKWYLIYQSQQPRFSTMDDPSQPQTLTTPTNMFNAGNPAGMPSLPIDYYVICDDNNCHLFFTGDDGKLYRTQTTIANFPHGWGALSVVMTYPTSVLFEGSSHYKVLGENTYLTIIEAMGSNGRWFAAWTATNLAGPWTEFKVNQSTPFAGLANVSFPSGQWTNDVSHGEMIRYYNDHKSVLDPANMQFLYQGRAPGSGGAYELLPYRLGLLTAVGATGGPPGGVGGGGGGSALYLEAECGTTETGGYAANSTSKAGYSGSGHLMSTGNTTATSYDGTSTDRATYSFTATSGTYTPYFRFDSDGDYANDSMFYRVNGGAWTMMNGFASAGTDWAWVAGAGGNVSLNGSSTIEIANREDGLGIDKIALVPTGSPAPSGAGGSASNCTAGISTSATYEIRGVNSNRCVDIVAASTSDGADVQMYDCHQGAAQRFRFDDMGGGYYRMRNINSSKCLDDYNWSTTPGSEVRQWTCGTGANQKWQVVLAGGQAHFINQHNGLAMEAWNMGTANGTAVNQDTYTGASDQKFYLNQL